jgi:hypothetical protein
VEAGQERMGILKCGHNVLSQEILDKNRPVCWSIVAMEKSAAGSSFFWTFPSDNSRQVTKDVNVHFFIHSRNYCTLYQRISGTF